MVPTLGGMSVFGGTYGGGLNVICGTWVVVALHVWWRGEGRIKG